MEGLARGRRGEGWDEQGNEERGVGKGVVEAEDQVRDELLTDRSQLAGARDVIL